MSEVLKQLGAAVMPLVVFLDTFAKVLVQHKFVSFLKNNKFDA